MNQITIEELSAYLPYKVKVKHATRKGNVKKITELTLSDAPWLFRQEYFKPLLRPISQLTTEIEVNGEKFVPIERLEELYQQLGYDNYSSYFIMSYTKRLPYEIVQFLLSLHFDIFGLLDRNLAEPIV